MLCSTIAFAAAPAAKFMAVSVIATGRSRQGRSLGSVHRLRGRGGSSSQSFSVKDLCRTRHDQGCGCNRSVVQTETLSTAATLVARLRRVSGRHHLHPSPTLIVAGLWPRPPSAKFWCPNMPTICRSIGKPCVFRQFPDTGFGNSRTAISVIPGQDSAKSRTVAGVVLGSAVQAMFSLELEKGNAETEPRTRPRLGLGARLRRVPCRVTDQRIGSRDPINKPEYGRLFPARYRMCRPELSRAGYLI